MGGSGRRRKNDPTEDVGSQLLLRFDLLEGLLPIGGREFQEAVPGPAGDEAQQVAQIGEPLNAVQSGAGEQRDEDMHDFAGRRHDSARGGTGFGVESCI